MIDTVDRVADIAMHHAKEYGKSSYKFFTSELNVKVSERFTLEAELRTPLKGRSLPSTTSLSLILQPTRW